MIIYLVTVNDKVSQEGFKTLEEAQNFVKERTWYDVVPKRFGEYYKNVPDLSGQNFYTIIDVRVK